jgi:uncharacterized repeat protein (TIGR02543 family)
MHFIKNYYPRRYEAIGTKAKTVMAFWHIFVSVTILLGMQMANAVSAATSTIVHEETKTGGSSNSTTVTTSASVTAVNGDLYLVAISTQPKASVLSVSGLGLNWTFVRAKCSGRNTTGIEVWMAQGTPSGSGAVTATLAQAPAAAVIAVSRYSGAASPNPIGNVISGNTTGINASAVCSGGVDNNAYSFNINATKENALVYGAVAMKEAAHTPGAGYTERDEIAQVNASNTGSVAVEDKTVASPASVAINGSFSSNVDWAVVALEIKPQPIIEYTLTVNTVGAGNVTLDPPGGVYSAGTVVTLTATPAAGHQFTGWSEALGGSANPATIAMTSNKNVTANFKANTASAGPVVYEGTRIGGASNSTTVTTSASVNAVNGHLYLAAISTQPKASVLSVSGMGLTWTFVRAKCSGRNTTGIEVWMAQGTPSGNGNVTATLAQSARTAVIAVSRYSGTASVNPIGNVIAGNTNGLNTNAVCSGGVDNNAYAFNLNTSVDSAVVYGAVAMKGLAHTPDASYTERAEVARVNGSNASSVAVEDKAVNSAGSVAVNGSFSGNVDWVLVALEIKPKPPIKQTLTVNTIGSGSVVSNPPGGIYNKGTQVTLTATPATGFQFSGWSGDLSGSTNPATITMSSDKNVTATFTANTPDSGPIVCKETKIGGASGSTTVATSASVTAVNGDLYLAAISTQPKASALSVTGLGLNWTLVRARCSGRNTTGIEVWMAQGIPQGGSSGNVTATLAQSARTAVIAVSRYSGTDGVNPIGNVITANTNGMNANASCTGGVDNNAYSFNLDTTVDSAVVYNAVAMKDMTHTPGAGYTERGETMRMNGINVSAVAVEDKAANSAGSATVNGSFSGNVDWAVVALEIKPKISQYTLTANTAGSGSVTLNPPGGTYDAGTEVTVTATPNAGFVFSGWSGDLSGSTNLATITMDSDKSVTAIFEVKGPIVHEETKTGGSSGSTTVTTSASVTAVNGNLYLAAISTQPKASVLSVTGLGLNWSLVRARCAGRNTTGIEVWMAQGTASGNGTVSATLAQAPGAAVIAVSRYSGVDPVNPIGEIITGNTNGMNTNAVCSGGADNNAYSFNLNTTVDSAVVYGAVAMKNMTHTPGAGYIERDEVTRINGGNVSSAAVEDKMAASAGSATVNGSLSGNVDWAIVALEIKPEIPQYTLAVNAAGSGSVTLNPPGGIYDAGTVVTLTPQSEAADFQFSGWSGDLSGAANPATITMNGNKNVTATFESTASSSAIVHQETQTGGSSGSTTVATSANVTAVNDHLYLAAISTRPKVQVTAVSGLGLNWTLVQAQCSGRDATGVEVWKAQGTPSSNGLVTATLASAPSNAVIAVSRYSGVKEVNPIGNMVSGNTNGVNGLCAAGTDTNLYAFNLTTTTSGSVVYGAVALRSRTHTPGAGYTERADFMQGTFGAAAAVAVEDKTVASASTVTVDGSSSGDVDWALVAFEIKPPLKLTVNILGSGSVALNPPGGIYDAGTVVTLTATPAAGFQFSGWGGALSGSTNPATITMNAPKTVTATFTEIGAGNQVVLEEIQTGTSIESLTVTTSSNLIAVSGHLYLAAISTKARLHLDGVTGLGLTWTLVKVQCAGRGTTMVEVWMALGTPTGNGPVTAHFPAAPTNAVITVLRYSGVNGGNPIGNVIAGSTNGENGSGVCTGGTDTAHYLFNLTTTTNDAVVCAAVAIRSRTHTPGAGYTERAELSLGTPNAAAGIAVMDKKIPSVSTVAVTGTLSDSTDWSVVAVEIKPLASASKRGVMTANENSIPPADFLLGQNYPNPFSSEAKSRLAGNPGTQISFSLPASGKVILEIYNETGQLVRTLLEGEKVAGWHSVYWNGRNQLGNATAAGIYLYRIVVHGEAGDIVFAQTRRMTLLK